MLRHELCTLALDGGVAENLRLVDSVAATVRLSLTLLILGIILRTVICWHGWEIRSLVLGDCHALDYSAVLAGIAGGDGSNTGPHMRRLVAEAGSIRSLRLLTKFAVQELAIPLNSP